MTYRLNFRRILRRMRPKIPLHTVTVTEPTVTTYRATSAIMRLTASCSVAERLLRYRPAHAPTPHPHQDATGSAFGPHGLPRCSPGPQRTPASGKALASLYVPVQTCTQTLLIVYK